MNLARSLSLALSMLFSKLEEKDIFKFLHAHMARLKPRVNVN